MVELYVPRHSLLVVLLVLGDLWTEPRKQHLAVESVKLAYKLAPTLLTR